MRLKDIPDGLGLYVSDKWWRMATSGSGCECRMNVLDALNVLNVLRAPRDLVKV